MERMEGMAGWRGGDEKGIEEWIGGRRGERREEDGGECKGRKGEGGRRG